MSMAFVHGGLPMPTRKAVVRASAAMAGGEAGASASSSPAAPSHAQPPADHEQPASVEGPQAAGRSIQSRLLALLSHPNIASKHWIIRQYDHEVQGGSVIKPLVGPHQQGPSDAAVLRPKLGSRKGVVIANGLTPHIADPYAMALASIDEAIRNAVCVGADPARLAILDNFCWPGTDDPQTMGTLVRAAEACRDAALTYRIPFISGKDSLHNQFKNSQTGQVIRIPPTLLISSIGVIDDIARCVTMDFKKPGSLVVLVTPGPGRTALSDLAQLHHTMHAALSRGLVAAAHDVSDGGLLVAAAEMAIASGLGLNFMITSADTLFAERSGAYVIEVRPEHSRELFALISDTGAMPAVVADTTADGRIVVPATDPFADPACDVTVDACRAAWLSPLDW